MKYSGKVGFADTREITIDVYEEGIVEKHMIGDFLRYSSQYHFVSQSTVSDIQANHRISLIGTPYAREKFQKMVYITINGERWRISAAELATPRIIVTLGGIYNGPEP